VKQKSKTAGRGHGTGTILPRTIGKARRVRMSERSTYRDVYARQIEGIQDPMTLAKWWSLFMTLSMPNARRNRLARLASEKLEVIRVPEES